MNETFRRSPSPAISTLELAFSNLSKSDSKRVGTTEHERQNPFTIRWPPKRMTRKRKSGSRSQLIPLNEKDSQTAQHYHLLFLSPIRSCHYTPFYYSSHLYIDSYSVITPMCLVDVWLRAAPSHALPRGGNALLFGRPGRESARDCPAPVAQEYKDLRDERQKKD